jgi:hypothetical protein
MVGTLQVLVSLIFFANKVCVLVERKRVGWFLGAIAAALAIFYFYLIGLYVFTALEFGLIVLMGYGVVKKAEKNPAVETRIRLVTIGVMLVLAYFAWTGLITIVELGSSLGLLLGTFFLTHSKPTTGWLLYVVGHSLAAYLGYYKEQQLFADFQVASAIVSIVGVMGTLPKALSKKTGPFSFPKIALCGIIPPGNPRSFHGS